MEISYWEWKEDRLRDMNLETIYLILFSNWGLDHKNRSQVRVLISPSYCEDNRTQ